MISHWNDLKAEWTLFKKLMRGDTCIGWDATKNTIMEDDDWWNQKIEDVRYRKFRNKDLSLIWFRYDALFSDIVTTGERARASNQPQFFETGVNFDEEIINCIDNDGREHFININDEGGDENKISTDGIGTSNQVEKSKTKSTTTSMKEDMHSLVELMSNKSTAISHAVDDPTIDKCMDFLANIPGIFERDIRQVFLKMPMDEARKSWMKYNYQLHLKKV
ncbi:hypothetical protein R3W88_008147 [Solanum pinnatisectum]|uniref:Myb/SANT-like domain-containing protein n=1 Tax=Solanum pinnatisectum TaxID=50273 RepID=A0AAV9M757_9SOLN|nr:hypothetical protein R3W88_008147 [Solanum pinnatisectum]